MLIWAVLTACRPDPPVAPDPSPLRVRTLDSGLRITVLTNRQPPDQATFELLVAAGSRHEAIPGTAHFVEHMAFNGTRSFPGTSLQTWLEDWGGPLGHDQNAHTSPDHTWFHVTGSTLAPSWLDTVPRVLRDWSDGLTFDRDHVEAERRVLGAELAARSLDAVSRRMGRALPSLQAEDLRSFHQTWYRPERMEILAVGDLDADETLAALEQAFAGFSASGPPPSEPLREPSGAKALHAPGGDEQILSMILPVDEQVSRAAAEVLARVLENRLGPLSHARVRLAGSEIRVDAAELRRPRGRSYSLAQRVLERLSAAAEPSPREVEVARDEVLLSWLDRPFALAPEQSSVWRQALHDARVAGAPVHEDPFARVEALRTRIEAISAADVAAAGRAVLRWEALSLTAVGSPPEAELQTLFQTADRGSEPPEPLPSPPERDGRLASQLVEPGVSVWRLDGGGEVLYRQLDVPVMVVAARVPFVWLPDGDLRSWADRLRAHDPGTAWSAVARPDHVRIAGRLLPDRLDVGLRRLAEVLSDHPELRVAIAGPATVAEASDRLAISLAGLPLPDESGRTPAYDPLPVPASHAVTAMWRRPLAVPADLERLPVLLDALEHTLRDALDATFDPRVRSALGTDGLRIQVIVPCAPGDEDRITAVLADVRSQLLNGAPAPTRRSWAPADPRATDPRAWAATMLDRIDVYPSLVAAWQAPRVAAPDRGALRDLARIYLAERPVYAGQR